MDYIDQNDHVIDHIDEHDELKPQLPAIIPPIAMNGHDDFVPKSEQDAVRSSHSSAKEKNMGLKCCNSVGKRRNKYRQCNHLHIEENYQLIMGTILRISSGCTLVCAC